MPKILKSYAGIVQNALIDKGRPAAGVRRPEEARYRFKNLAEFVFVLLRSFVGQESGLFFGLLAFINVDSHFPPAGFVHQPTIWLPLSVWILSKKFVRATVRVRAVHQMRHYLSACKFMNWL